MDMDAGHSMGLASSGRDSTAASLEALLAAQSDHRRPETLVSRPPTSELKCCCGQVDCAFLRHNNAQLHGLEKNVQTAAQMGQALLIRHENYMADAERERRSMIDVIGKLETEKRELEAENMRAVEENRNLLDQLEELNNSVAEADDRIQSLTSTLLSTQTELQRLTALASRTAQLEAQLALLEEEQAQLQGTLMVTKEDERSAVQRWKRAERTLGDLQDQIERVEREAREERERHIEVLGRLERRRAVEKELDSAAGRLKGAAAAKTLGKDKGGSSVVSHFVKDILQDNANLQMGIVELREMLLISNEEVQTLREQLMMHQPVLENGDGQLSATLRKELGLESSPRAPQEVHVHHHYHAPPRAQESPTREKVAPLRRPKKKRNVIAPTLFNPPSPKSLRSPSHLMDSPGPSTAAAILSQTSVSVPPPAAPQFSSKRSSIQSTHALSLFASSVPSSPPSIFDRAFGSSVVDSSRPTSPENSEPYSPEFSSRHFKRGSDASYRSISTPIGMIATAPVTAGLHPTREEDDADAEYTDRDTAHSNDGGILPEDVEHSHEMTHSDSMASVETNANDSDGAFRPNLRRSASHESILSIPALDVPAIRNRPSQVFLGKGAYSSPRTTLGIVSPSTALDTGKPVLTAMTATARPASRKGWRCDSSTYNRHLLESRWGYHDRNPSVGDSVSDGTGQQKDQTLSRKVGGWVWGRWGVRPETSSRSTKPNPVLEGRPPGVNQPGPIKGIFPELDPETSRGGGDKGMSVLVSEVDNELLKETLREQA
ncbi:hypothetical protein GP486_001721 [Trichoglossum hirsutum]|uniref:Uncharacterized protein n=1 Tax=Trichoglossum hirsutum TaxID=265104 RepID=A0A9P8LGF9_9PEZI|nr:hypothetical protein GP486_001721 [Trichoglossum hirsutum]